jgi:hypothetical protein
MTPAIYIHLPPGATPPPADAYRPFKAVLVIEQAVDEEWRNLTCSWLVKSGCLALMAWGEACEAWHDAVDHANLAAHGEAEVTDETLIMTTWHDREPLAETLWFAARTAFHPVARLRHTLIIHIAPEPRRDELLQAFTKAALS